MTLLRAPALFLHVYRVARWHGVGVLASVGVALKIAFVALMRWS